MKEFINLENQDVLVSLEDSGEDFIIKNPIGELKFAMFDLDTIIGLLIDLQEHMGSE